MLPQIPERDLRGHSVAKSKGLKGREEGEGNEGKDNKGAKILVTSLPSTC